MLSSERRLSPEEGTWIGDGSINSGSGSGLWLSKSAWKIGMIAIFGSCDSSRVVSEQDPSWTRKDKRVKKGGCFYKVIVINAGVGCRYWGWGALQIRSNQFIVL
jgi:hypothetical protein